MIRFLDSKYLNEEKNQKMTSNSRGCDKIMRLISQRDSSRLAIGNFKENRLLQFRSRVI